MGLASQFIRFKLSKLATFGMVIKKQIANYMTLFSRLSLVSPLALLCISGATMANEEAFQSIQLGVTQQSQEFDFNDSTTSLNVWGMSGQYQYGQGPWNLILGYQQGNASNSEQNYDLDFETQGYSTFVEYYFETTWLALGYAKSEDKTAYVLDRNNGPDARHLNQVNYDSFSLESGYSYYTESGQINTTQGLIKQEVDDFTSRTDFADSDGELQVNEDGILISFALSYGHFFAISDRLRLALNLGLRREITLSGESRIPRSGRAQEQSSNQQTASTSQQGQISLQSPRGSLSLGVDKLTDQSFSDGYFSAGVSWNF